MKIFSRTRSHSAGPEKSHHPDWGFVTYRATTRGRRIKLSVEPWIGLVVLLPQGIGRGEANKLITEHQTWLQQAKNQAEKVEERSRLFFRDANPLERTELRIHFQKHLDALAARYNFSYSRLSIRNQKTRWGSCSGSNSISLNQKLQFLPDSLIEYVLLHELAHTVEKNHGPRFWKILFDIFGETETKKSRRQLREYEFLFHPPPQD